MTSLVFSRLSDKAELVKALKETDSEWAAPPQLALRWDYMSTPEPRADLVWSRGEKEPDVVVLKPSGACGGAGIEFFRHVTEALLRVRAEAEKVAKEPGTLQYMEDLLGGPPQWVLQGHIESLLVEKDRKFHVRAYAAYDEETKGILVCKRYEVRVAGAAYTWTLPNEGGARVAHITNGAGGIKTKRLMFDEVNDLAAHRSTLDVFMMRLFGRNHNSGLAHLIRKTATELDAPGNDSRCAPNSVRSFGICACDLMLDKTGTWYLLEVNKTPGAPPEEGAKSGSLFRRHLQELALDAVHLALGRLAMLLAKDWELVHEDEPQPSNAT